MSVVTEGVARIQHVDTDEIYDIKADELDWQEGAADERQMGVEVGYFAQVEHPQLGTLEWELWEYPPGMENDRSVNVGRHRLLQNFEISLGGSSSDGAEDEGEDEEDVDPEEFQAKVDGMVEWFRERYEDPAERTPYESAEGGYQWIYGGPYDAREQLGDEFPDDEAALDAAVKEIESDGIYDWSPTPAHEHGRFDDDDPDGDPADDRDEDDDEPSEALSFALQLALNEVPGPQPGPRFGPDAVGRLELLGWQEDEEAAKLQPLMLLAELCEAARELVSALMGTNTHPELLAEAQRYAVAVSDEALPIGQFYACGVRLENTDFALAAEMREGDRPPLLASQAVALQSLLHLHAATLMSHPQGAAWASGAAAYRRPSGATADAQAAARRFSAAVQAAGTLIGPRAQAAVAEAAEALGAGPNPERSSQVSGGVLGGFVRAVAGALKVADSGMLGRFVWDSLKGTVIVGTGITGATGGLDLVYQLLLDQAPNLAVLAAYLGTELHWLETVAGVLMRVRDWVKQQGDQP
ncbi:hypothetical protein [Phenylobacterium sp.]|uniref:hypothetical protein n=1 Tax=Phenylobacterium sp. TaxID=1871053 RepID=UPI00356781CF